MRSLTRRIATAVVAVTLLAGCSSGSGGDAQGGSPADDASSSGPVTLTFWSWAPNIAKVVDLWNAEHPDIRVKVSQPAQGDALVTKLLTADKAGNPPDLAQAEYQALPSLVVSNAVADITQGVAQAKSAFSDETWGLTTFSGKVYAVPQDVAPMMLYYRADLFQKFGLKVPTTWTEFAQDAATLRAKDPKRYLTTFSAQDPGWFAGLSQQAGANWWAVDGDAWRVGIADAATQKVAGFWQDLVERKQILDQPMYTPQWNKQLNDGTLLAWPSAIWGAGVLEGIAPDTRGKWKMAPMPQWTAGGTATGFWGGSSTAVMQKSQHKAQAVEFATWLNSDPKAVDALVSISAIYPASTDGQATPALAKPPAFMPNQPDFFQQAAEIAKGAKGFTWGPNVNVTYAAYKDAFAKVIQNGTPFASAVDQMQSTTVADMKKTGFSVSGG